MRLVDEIEILRAKIKEIDNRSVDSDWPPSEAKVLETAFWARSLLEVVEDLPFPSYGHPLRTNLRLVEPTDDPDNPGLAKAVYRQNRNLGLMKLLAAMIHFRYFTYDEYADGNHGLTVMSDRDVLFKVFYADFIGAISSLLLPRRVAVLAVCDLVEQRIEQLLEAVSGSFDSGIPAMINLHWLLAEHARDDELLKGQILEDIFKIDDVPMESRRTLAFFLSGFHGVGVDPKMRIGFFPAWEEGQDQISAGFGVKQLFEIVRGSTK